MWEFWRSGRRSFNSRRTVSSPEGGAVPPPLAVGEKSDLEDSTDDLSPYRNSSASPRPVQSHVDFKDLRLPVDDPHDGMGEGHDLEVDGGALTGLTSGAVPRTKMVQKHKLIIVVVGLPGRGKTFLCNKLCCYLNWLGHSTQHFNVGYYRRKQNVSKETQDASFFDKDNTEGKEKRLQAVEEALHDMISWLSTDHAQVAIFDATNSTEERRRMLISKFHGTWQYLFLESVCNDPAVLEANYRYKMRFSPDYQGIDMEKAVEDFKDRIRRYDAVYETITDRNIHYIKMINMVTGRGHLDINRISGYIPGKIVFYLMQVCKIGMSRTRKIWLSRHGESEYNVKGLLGGDSGISEQGWEYAQLLPDVIFDRLPLSFDDSHVPVSVWTSTLKRTIETAEYLPFPKLRWKALDEIHAGVFDSHTYQQISEKYPDEYAARKANKLAYRYPNGESYLDVIQRLEPVIIEIERERECVIVIAHQAILRAMYGYFTNKPLSEIPRIEIPLHTIIELTPRPDGTMEEERFSTGIPTTKKKAEAAAAAAAHFADRVPRSPAASVDQAPLKKAKDQMSNPQTTSTSSGGGNSPTVLLNNSWTAGAAPGEAERGLSLSVVRENSASSQRLSRTGAMARSMGDLQLQPGAMHIPALNQSKHWAEEGGSLGRDDSPNGRLLMTSDEGPGGPEAMQAKEGHLQQRYHHRQDESTRD